MPGVLLCEAAMQSGAILISHLIAESGEENGGVPVATRINNVKVKRPVRPGDELEIDVQLTERLANAFFMKAKIKVAGKTVVSLDFAASNATSVAAALKRLAGPLYQAETQSLVNENVTRPLWRAVSSAYAEQLKSQATADDLLVVFLSGHGVRDVHIVIDDIEDRVQRGRDDARSARAARHHVDRAVAEQDGRRHARERPLARRDGVRAARIDESVDVGLIRRLGKVVHLVVEHHPRARRRDARSEGRVDGHGECHGAARGVAGREVRGPRVVRREARSAHLEGCATA